MYMIISVEELKRYISTEETDAVLEAKLQAQEILIRKYTNNNFQNRNFRFRCNASSQNGIAYNHLFNVGDTVEITDSVLNNGLYVIASVDAEHDCMALNKALYDECEITVTKIEYPDAIKMGVVGMIKWDLETGSKVGIQSETISRHSVTYFDMNGDNSKIGYPKSVIGFLKPYMKARF